MMWLMVIYELKKQQVRVWIPVGETNNHNIFGNMLFRRIYNYGFKSPASGEVRG